MPENLTDQMETENPRRKFIKDCAFFLAGGGAMAVTGVEKPVMQLIENEPEIKGPEAIKRKESEIAHNWQETFAQVFQLENELNSQGTGSAEIVFVDQDGNIIERIISTESKKVTKDGKTITIPAWNEEKKLNQEWLNAWRQYFYEKYPTIEFDLTEDEELSKQFNTIKQLRGTDHKKMIDLVLKNGAKTTVGSSMNRVDFIKNEFEKIKGLPDGVKERLILISYGVAATESQFDASKESPKKAKGIWQIVPDTMEEYGYDKDEIINYRSLKTSTEVAKKHFVKIYKYIESHVKEELEWIRSEFGFSQEELENYFLFPCMINAYNTGQGRMVEVIQWFAQNYDREKLTRRVGSYEKYGYDLFIHMTRFCLEEKSVDGYRRHSREYFLQTNGMAAQIRKKWGIPNKVEEDALWDEDEEYEEPPISQDSPGKESYPVAKVIAAVAGGGGAVALRRKFLKKGWNIPQPVIERMIALREKILGATEKMSTVEINRRKFAEKALLIFMGAGGGSLITSRIFSDSKKERQGDSRKEKKEKKEKQIEDGFLHAPELANDLLKEEKLFSNKTPYSVQKMPRRIQSSQITPWMKRNKLNLYDDLEDIQNDGSLVSLDEYGNPHYRCRKIGYAALSGRLRGYENHPDYIKVKESTHKLVEVIGEKLNEELHQKFGLNERYTIRVIVNSATRDSAYNALLGNSSPNSSHRTGYAVDFGTGKFDIFDTKTGKFLFLDGQRGNELDEKYNIRHKAKAALSKILKEMHENGEIYAMIESGHYHVTDKGGMK
jgi:hypothetical protein